MSTQDITVPDIGGAEGVEIIEVCVAPGDAITAEQSLIVLETDKATMEIPSEFEGTIASLTVSVGDKVSQGDKIGEVSTGDSTGSASDSASAPAAEAVPEPVAEPTSVAAAASVASAASVDATVPDGVEEAEVIEVSVAVGDTIAEGDTLAVLETDKATVEVPANAAGTVTEIKITVGDKISSGDVVVSLGGGSAPVPAPTEAPAPAAQAEPAPVAATATPATLQATVPEGAEDAEVIEISVAVGDTIAEGDTLAVLETDKATVDVPANAAGKVTSIAIKIGDKISSGDLVVTLEGSAAAAPVAAQFPSAQSSVPQPAATTSSTAVSKPAPTVTPSPLESGALDSAATDVYAGPAVRTHARDLGVNLKEVKATGPRGRILKEDVDNYVKKIIAQKDKAPTASSGSGIPAMPEIDFTKFGEVEVVPMTKIQKITAFNMHRNWLNIPAVTQFDDADITELEAFRKGLKAEAEKRGVKLTPLPFLLKACAAALRAEPTFNVSITADGESLVKKDYVNIGIAADTPNGLMVPVIRDVDKKGLWQLAEEANAIIKKARDGKLTPADMQGGCFTISSLGAMGGNGFTPIVNAPEVAILGVSKAQMKPIWNGKDFEPRNMLPLALSYDHRAINGADCGRFFTYLVSVIADVRRLLL
ncbi:dihydrolipoyllysine-residue acetyltransferase [Marinibactrum halimedae]|uniref:Acetyltransferase component of pyruvate dehydrogenase complex n=1 Tax=Marinibactrum halimedae TaxID=1444977 RepID=A0AA37T8P6_9GAMM|nr:dihydrolipoyllysine-residue acetyltransferase [Marinibactrum halimedae]MCD9457983.1 dihydrolipoyllysine-residue acetyltransferase [Marinibactrum halimedae]GLS27609.1 acetyltransferase component of pyruvate dehydrogenase complex [Marinibactrum halimedae]